MGLAAAVAAVGWFGSVSARGQLIRVLPLGDSITLGVNGATSYRLPLWRLLWQAGVPVDYVGSRTDFCSAARAVVPGFDCNHEGHGGWRVQDLLDDCTSSDPCGQSPELRNQGNLIEWSRLYQADIALVHIGTNDVLQRTDPFTYLINLWILVDALRFNNPSMRIFLAQIPPLNGRISSVALQNFFVFVVAVLRTTPESPIALVDMFNGFNIGQLTSDGIHPNQLGDQWMAERWFLALAAAGGI
jgi:lysophospholipase L1-like esterase